MEKMKKGGFLKSNWTYLIWFIFYFLISFGIICIFTEPLYAFLIALLIYAITITVSLSPIGEGITRYSIGARKLSTNTEKERLISIFKSVYEEALAFYPHLNKNIQLYILNDNDLNAFALGRSTICLTVGSINGFNDNELKGILAHEFGHLANGDTKSLMLTNIGNGFFSLVISIIDLCIKIFNWFISLRDDMGIVKGILTVIIYILRFLIWVFVGIGDILLSINSRYCETLADKFAYDIGFGEELIKALYILNKISPSSKDSIFKRLKHSHPLITSRIERLENYD